MIAKRIRTAAVVKSAYDGSATSYDRVRFGTAGGRYVDRKEQEFVAEVIQGPTVLEVGTATGRFAVSLIRRGAEYTGVDLSKNMLRITFERTNQIGSVVQMDGTKLGFRSYFDYVLCVRTFHFLPKPVDALKGMFAALGTSGQCLVTFETDNPIRRLLVFLGIGISEQYYYKISDVEDLFLQGGFEVMKSGAVMRIPVTLYRGCPRSLLWILERLDKLWPWAMHEYVLGVKRELVRLASYHQQSGQNKDRPNIPESHRWKMQHVKSKYATKSGASPHVASRGPEAGRVDLSSVVDAMERQ